MGREAAAPPATHTGWRRSHSICWSLRRPKHLRIRYSWSWSLSPGNSGSRVTSSASRQPAGQHKWQQSAQRAPSKQRMQRASAVQGTNSNHATCEDGCTSNLTARSYDPLTHSPDVNLGPRILPRAQQQLGRAVPSGGNVLAVPLPVAASPLWGAVAAVHSPCKSKIAAPYKRDSN